MYYINCGVLSMLNFRTIRFLSSIFTPELNISSSINFVNIAIELLGDKLEENPIILPIPQDAPANIPRIQLTSADKKWNLSISLERTDLIYFDPSLSGETFLDIKDFTFTSSQFLSEFKDRLDLAVQRIAFVTERILPEEKADFIIDRFCKKELKQEGKPFNNVRQFEIHSRKRYDYEGYKINSWVRIKSVDLKTKNIITPGVMIVNDLNTLPYSEDPENRFSSKEIEDYFDKMYVHLNEILNKYFSNEEK
jgi:hypothetical protein